MNKITRPFDEEDTEPQANALANERQRLVFSEHAYYAIQAAIFALQRTVSAFAETPETSLSMATANRPDSDLPNGAAASIKLAFFNQPETADEPRVEADLCLRLPGRPDQEITVSVVCLADGTVIPVPKHT